MKRGELGSYGEKIATFYLKKNGYVIIDQNWYTRFGELDIIAFDKANSQLVFIEVKTRKGSRNTVIPEYSITKRKLQKCVQAALLYIAKNNIIDEYRFDSFAINLCIVNSKNRVFIRHCKSITNI